MNTDTILHSLLLVVGVAAYVILTALGHDGNAVLTAVLGYAGGAGVAKATATTKTGA